MSVNRKSFESNLHFNGDWQGSRVKDVMSNPENADIIAAAIGASLLNNLIASASAKPLYPKDLVLVLEAFMEAAGMVNVDMPMGGTQLQRKLK
jgi:hypothetical protein